MQTSGTDTLEVLEAEARGEESSTGEGSSEVVSLNLHQMLGMGPDDDEMVFSTISGKTYKVLPLPALAEAKAMPFLMRGFMPLLVRGFALGLKTSLEDELPRFFVPNSETPKDWTVAQVIQSWYVSGANDDTIADGIENLVCFTQLLIARAMKHDLSLIPSVSELSDDMSEENLVAAVACWANRSPSRVDRFFPKAPAL